MNALRCSVIAVLFALTFAATSRAGTIQVLEPAEGSNTWTVTVAGLPTDVIGVTPNGVYSVSTAAEAIFFTYNAGRLAAASQTFVGVLFEDGQLTLPSDIITVTTTQGSAVISVLVNSDGELPLTLPTGITTRAQENGTYQLMATVTFGDTTTDTIFLQSDAEAVPEPGTFAVFGIGIACLSGFAWRRRNNTAA